MQEYGYDALNRLTSVYDKPFNGAADFYQLYRYDRWGNRTVDQNSWNTPKPNFTASPATNRLAPPAGYTMTYDAAGNLTFDNYTGAGSRAYDAENRMTSAQDYFGQTSTYAYDADRRRVRRRVAGGPEVWQVHGMGGELLAEYAAGAAPQVPQKEYGYRGGELLVTAEAPAVTNLALGKTATQSSTYAHAANPAASKAVDGNSDGNFFNSSLSHTNSEAQAWWHVDLGAVGQLNAVRVWNRSDCCADRLTNFYVLVSDVPFTSASLSATLSQPGVSAYQTTAQAGRPTTVSVNRTGRYVRVQLAGTNYLGLAEVEVLGAGGTADVRWLVADQLGTPRMVIDRTGSLAGVRRHDYLPFGEEIPSEATWRTTARGYAGDDVRQKFTRYERDAETGLDFAQARYFASAAGRFTSVDPFNIVSETAARAKSDPDKAHVEFVRYLSQPGKWNRYTYVVNNPVKYVDPTGEELELTGDTAAEREAAFARIREMVDPSARDLLYVERRRARGKIRYYVRYSGNFASRGPLEAKVAKIIDDRRTTEYRVGTTYTDKYGKSHDVAAEHAGAATIPGYFSNNGNVQIIVHPDSGRIGTAAIAQGRPVTDDGQPYVQTNTNTDAHEFGHAYAEVTLCFGYSDSPPFKLPRDNVYSRDTSLEFENYTRRRTGSSERKRH